MRRNIALMMALAGLLTAETAGESRILAADGTIRVRIHEAIANLKGEDDKPFGPQQDFYAINSIDGGPPLFTPMIDQRDYATWDPPQVNTKLVPGMNQRYFDLYFELWDLDPHDFGNVDDGFDISPQSGPPGPLAPGGVYVPNIPTGSNPHVDYDVCTGELVVKGVNGSAWIPIGSNKADLRGKGTTPGIPVNWGTLRISVEADPPNWLPEDIKVTDVQILQSIYGQAKAVADKDTILTVRVFSTYPSPITAPLIGQMDDGFFTVNDSKMVTIQPGDNQYYLFEPPRVTPFHPYKPPVVTGPNQGVVHGWARIDYVETVSPNAPLELQDCANINNIGKATDLPLEKVTDLKTVYSAFDYDEDMSFITAQQLNTMKNREETFRLATWPLAALDGSVDFTQLHRDHGGDFPFVEPFTTIMRYDFTTLFMSNTDRLVLSVRPGWFAANAFRHQFVANGSVGWSLGWFARHAVLAESGNFGTAVHELGHSFDMSPRPCSSGNCPDEYSHPASDSAPYEAVGYDVNRQIYPGGFLSNQPNLQCPARGAGSLDVCASNIMDSNCFGFFCNWIDSLSFHWLMEQLPHIDPMLITVSGMVRLPSGFGGPGDPPPVVDGMIPFFSYQQMGNQDLPEAPLTGMGEAFTGSGMFWIRFVTPAGVRDYRFTPRFLDDPPAADVIGGFSLRLPWDPQTTAIQLIGLDDVRDVACQNQLCPGLFRVLAERPVTLLGPSISDLRAGLDTAPPSTPPGSTPPVPVIGPGHDAVLAFDTFDPDSPEVRALILVMPQDAAGGSSGTWMPVAIDTTSHTVRIPHDRLAEEPGSYLVRVVASDGANTADLSTGGATGPLFTVCNFTNGGVEICNGIDDDCDGIVDDVSAPGAVSVELNPQPLPPGGDSWIAWLAEPLAQAYDVVFGDLGMLAATAGDFGAALLGCLADDVPDTSTPSGPAPAPGGAFFYLVRGENCAGPGTWNEKNPGPAQLDRDPLINGSPSACQP